MRDQSLAVKENTIRSYKEAFRSPAGGDGLACGVWIGVSVSGITVRNFYRESLFVGYVGGH